MKLEDRMLPHNVGKSLKKSLIFTISKNNLAMQIWPILAQNSKLGGTRKKSPNFCELWNIALYKTCLDSLYVYLYSVARLTSLNDT